MLGPVTSAKAMARPATARPGHRGEQEPSAVRPRGEQGQPEQPDAGAEHRGDQAEDDGPAEHGPRSDGGRGGGRGWPGRRCRIRSASSRPTKMSVPMPAARSPGTRTRPSSGPPRPAASISRKAPRMGDPNRVLMAAKLPAEAITMAAVGGASRLARLHRQEPEPAADGDERRLRSEDHAEAQGGQRGEDHPGQLGRGGCPAPALNPSAGMWPAVPGRYVMVAADQHAGQGQQRQGPPHRRAGESELLGQRGEDPVLEQADQLEEPVGHGGHRDPDEGGQHQELDVALRAEHGHRVGLGGRLVGAGGSRRRLGGRARRSAAVAGCPVWGVVMPVPRRAPELGSGIDRSDRTRRSHRLASTGTVAPMQYTDLPPVVRCPRADTRSFPGVDVGSGAALDAQEPWVGGRRPGCLDRRTLVPVSSAK